MTKAVDNRIKDVTDKFQDVNPYDRLYQSEHGYLIKVRVVDMSHEPSSMNFRITGSWANDKTGKARSLGDQPFIVAPDELHVRHDTPVDLAALLEDKRRGMVERVDRAAANYFAKQALTGVLMNPATVT